MDTEKNEDAEACLALIQGPEVVLLEDDPSEICNEVLVEDCTVEIQSSPIEYVPGEVEHSVDIDLTEEIIRSEEVLIKEEVVTEEIVDINGEDFLEPTSECIVEIDQDYNEMECVYIREDENSVEYENTETYETDEYGDVVQFYCTICGEGFTSDDELRNHMMIHSTNKLIKCAVCDKTFTDSKVLASHMTTSHPENGSIYACHFCDKIFKRKFNLDYHLTQHSRPKITLFQCKTCGEQFSNRTALNTHMNKHTNSTNNEKVTCNICNKSFQKNYLKIHYTSHTNTFDYSCNFCEKVLSSKQSLYMHMNTVHANEGCYECKYCHKRFFWKSYLDRHVTVHTKEKNYHCSLCSKSFTRKLALQKHEVSHTTPKPTKEISANIFF